MEAKVDFLAIDFPQENGLTVHIAAAVPELEALMTSAHHKATLQVARSRGANLGKPAPGLIARHAQKGAQVSTAVRSAAAQKRAADILPVIKSLQAEGATTLTDIAEALNGRGIPAPRGGRWSTSQVSRILARA
jgi:DNA invertase Pin-like site-specific DNA recombinase